MMLKLFVIVRLLVMIPDKDGVTRRGGRGFFR
jgi:hypothetical protein